VYPLAIKGEGIYPRGFIEASRFQLQTGSIKLLIANLVNLRLKREDIFNQA
jgi:hypothetical protein